MIKTLLITNYALIDSIEIEFDKGFNIITGETGAGKSIILGALGLLLGERADLRVIRNADRKSVIEAEFGLEGTPALNGIFADEGIDSAGNTCILRRELMPGGRSRAYINDTPVTLPVLRRVAEHLVDIHAQNQNSLLASAEYQLDVLDAMADNADVLTRYKAAYVAYRRALKSYTDTRDAVRRYRDDADYIAYQYRELDEMELVPGEHEALEREREALAGLDDTLNRINNALRPLIGEPANIGTALDEAVGAVEELDMSLDSEAEVAGIDFHSLSERLEAARIEINDIADTLDDYRRTLDADPARLAEVDERLGRLYSLETKHHVENADGLIEIRDRLRLQLSTLENSEETLAQLETDAKRAKRAAMALANELSERRADAALALSQRLCADASPLGMPNLRCEIRITRGKLTPDGADQVQYLFSFNKNQTPMPLGGAASGGEVSRLALTLRAILAERIHLPSIVFDEVDTGVSGDIATRMAAMMVAMSRSLQVICITHLPGVAAMGDVHFKVFKEDDETCTTTHVRRLDRQQRQAEIALMLSGDATDTTALAAARTMLNR